MTEGRYFCHHADVPLFIICFFISKFILLTFKSIPMDKTDSDIKKPQPKKPSKPKAKAKKKKSVKKPITISQSAKKKIIRKANKKLDAKPLTAKQKAFCREYVIDWNATRSYRIAYPNTKTDNTAAVQSHRLLRNTKVKDYCADIQNDLEKLCGISKAMIINEHKKLAFSSIAHLHNTWVERKEFDKLTEEQKLCIEEISTKIQHRTEWEGEGDKKIPIDYTVEYVKIKLYSKQRSLESISKMQGYDAPTKLILGGGLSNDIKIGFE